MKIKSEVTLNLDLETVEIETGIFPGEQYRSKSMSVDNIYALHQDKWPTLDILSSKIEKEIDTYVADLCKDGFGYRAYERVANRINSLHKRIVYRIKVPPNSKSTIKRKGFNNPLIETGEMVRKIKYKVNNGQAKGGG